MTANLSPEQIQDYEISRREYEIVLLRGGATEVDGVLCLADEEHYDCRHIEMELELLERAPEGQRIAELQTGLQRLHDDMGILDGRETTRRTPQEKFDIRDRAAKFVEDENLEPDTIPPREDFEHSMLGFYPNGNASNYHLIVKDRIDALESLKQALAENLHIRMGSDVKVVRSDGRQQSGWQVKDIQATGKLLVENTNDDELGATKSVSPQYLFVWNPKPEEETAAKLLHNSLRSGIVIPR